MKTILAILFSLGASTLLAQTPAFDVAVVKPESREQYLASIRPGQRPLAFAIDKNRIHIVYQSLSAILARAYGVAPFQIAGPEYLATERFEILATIPEGGTEEQVPQMLQALLAERFKLAVHREKKETGVYALVVSKGGLNPKNMKPATEEEMAPEPMPGDRTQSTPFGNAIMRQTATRGVVAFIPGFGTLKTSSDANGAHYEMSNLTTDRLAQMFTSASDRVVVDKTGLRGSYEASFDIPRPVPPPPPPEGTGSAAAAVPPVNPMFPAVEQLGLKLEQQKDLVEMIVIDHIEKTPTEN
jgi:uncharacterized protein (TIGR03435 family)